MRLRVFAFSLLAAFALAHSISADEDSAPRSERDRSQNSSQAEQGRNLNGRMRAEILRRFDANSNGQLEAEEMAKAREEFQNRMGNRKGMIKRFDSDGDGMLSDQERREMRRAVGRGGAGAITASERKPRLDQTGLLEKFDEDKDGALDPAERLAAVAEIRKRRSK